MQFTHAIPSQTAAGLVFAALTLSAAPALHTRRDPAAGAGEAGQDAGFCHI